MPSSPAASPSAVELMEKTAQLRIIAAEVHAAAEDALVESQISPSGQSSTVYLAAMSAIEQLQGVAAQLAVIVTEGPDQGAQPQEFGGSYTSAPAVSIVQELPRTPITSPALIRTSPVPFLAFPAARSPGDAAAKKWTRLVSAVEQQHFSSASASPQSQGQSYAFPMDSEDETSIPPGLETNLRSLLETNLRMPNPGASLAGGVEYGETSRQSSPQRSRMRVHRSGSIFIGGGQEQEQEQEQERVREQEQELEAKVAQVPTQVPRVADPRQSRTPPQAEDAGAVVPWASAEDLQHQTKWRSDVMASVFAIEAIMLARSERESTTTTPISRGRRQQVQAERTPNSRHRDNAAEKQQSGTRSQPLKKQPSPDAFVELEKLVELADAIKILDVDAAPAAAKEEMMWAKPPHLLRQAGPQPRRQLLLESRLRAVGVACELLLEHKGRSAQQQQYEHNTVYDTSPTKYEQQYEHNTPEHLSRVPAVHNRSPPRQAARTGTYSYLPVIDRFEPSAGLVSHALDILQGSPNKMVNLQKSASASIATLSKARAKLDASRMIREDESKLRAVFNYLDKSKVGKISVKELMLALRHDPNFASLLHLPANVHQDDGTHAAFERVFGMIADRDGNRKMTFAEFSEHISSGGGRMWRRDGGNERYVRAFIFAKEREREREREGGGGGGEGLLFVVSLYSSLSHTPPPHHNLTFPLTSSAPPPLAHTA